MLGGPALWATVWMAFASDRWDFDRSETRPAPRTTWHAVRRPDRADVASRDREDPPRPTRADEEPAVEPGSDSADDLSSAPPLQNEADSITSSQNWPPDISQSLDRLELARRAAMAGQPVEAWRFDLVRSGYEGLLKSHANDPPLQAEIRARLARLRRFEDAAEAARKVDAILQKSHRRDQTLNELSQKLADLEEARIHAFRAIGMIQPSSKRSEGRKLYTLIGMNGSRRAYLDVPPGIEIDRLMAHRVGVRGSVNYSEELGARLITVRDLEDLDARE